MSESYGHLWACCHFLVGTWYLGGPPFKGGFFRFYYVSASCGTHHLRIIWSTFETRKACSIKKEVKLFGDKRELFGDKRELFGDKSKTKKKEEEKYIWQVAPSEVKLFLAFEM